MKPHEIQPGKTYVMTGHNYSAQIMPRLVLSYDPGGDGLGGQVRAMRVRYGRPQHPVEIYCGVYFCEHVKGLVPETN